MENKEFQKILLKSAFLAMAADGHIHDDELKEINNLATTRNYFSEIDFKNEIKELIDKINSDYKAVYLEYFDFFENNYLSTVEIMLIFEVLMKIVYADLNITEEEKNFIRFLRKKFSYVPNDIFAARFGNEELMNIENKIPSFESKKIDLSTIDLNDFFSDELNQNK